MDDVAPGLNENELAELCALADGTLPAERRAAVEARVAASPELQALLDRQRSALAATRSLASEPAPESLRERSRLADGPGARAAGRHGGSPRGWHLRAGWPSSRRSSRWF
jgi:anti-sigma factor RsiW